MGNLKNPDLWKRIEAYDADQSGAKVPLSIRLARENGWPAAYAAQVIDEYKRFIYMICTSGELLIPSPDVDKAWHLHLIYTKDYWQRFCRDTLGREVHHQPIGQRSGAEDELMRAYKRTIALLANEFDEMPPRSVWPADGISTSQAPKMIDPSKYFIVPRSVGHFVIAGLLLLMAATVAWAFGFLTAAEALTLGVVALIACTGFLLPVGRRKKDDVGCGAGCGGD